MNHGDNEPKAKRREPPRWRLPFWVSAAILFLLAACATPVQVSGLIRGSFIGS